MKMKISKEGTGKKESCLYTKMKKNQKGGRMKKTPSYPCMKMKISKGGPKTNHVPMRK
jgi:hypothetical protein